jgi:very-short-patch-repair endonuclease
MPVSRKSVENARSLRRELTPPEAKLRTYLRTRPLGLKFRRQHPIGIFSLDFYCASVKLAIEIDGVAHDMGDNPARDIVRDAWVAEQGVRTLRISPPPRDCVARSPSPSDDGEEKLLSSLREARGGGPRREAAWWRGNAMPPHRKALP